jgi:hypothetical protein
LDADPETHEPETHEPETIVIDDGVTMWRFDGAFLRSNWTCIWGAGCLGIHDHPAPQLGEGCCSVGAELDDGDEAMTIAALAATLDPARFQHHDDAVSGGIFATGDRRGTRVVDGACVFLNRPGFAGGEGCALHLAALDADESPLDWKPSVCWQLPIKVDWAPTADGRETATVRGWSRGDWGDEGQTMAWCCTEGPLAYVGDRPVVDSLADELEAIAGRPVYVELRRRLAAGDDERP